MSIEELSFKVDQLGFGIEENDEKQRTLLASVKNEAEALRTRLVALGLQKHEKVTETRDDNWTRRIEWQIDNCSETFGKMEQDASMYSPEFSVLGFQNMQLELFPKGRSSTHLEGFCSLFVWCPAGVRLKYHLRVGDYLGATDEDEFTSRMAHGHSNFCSLLCQIDKETDSVKVGIEILYISGTQEMAGGIKLHRMSPESLIDKEACILRHRDIDCVKWTIKNIRKRMREVPLGLALCSPLFSAAGIGGMLLEFYPNGVSKEYSKEGGFCGFYLRCPAGTSLILTLFVGTSNKGPIQCDFDGNITKGLPAFCKLQEQLIDGQEDLVVGIKLRNPVLEKEEDTTSLLLSSEDNSFVTAR